MLDDLEKKGYVNQCTNSELLSELLKKKKIVFYLGFDCTAKSLHIGNLAVIMLARKLQKAGHKPVILIGSATTKIGDPHGKTEMRKLLPDSVINDNIKGIKKSLLKFLKFENNKSKAFNDALMVSNDDWLSKINYCDFLREYGKFISINRMVNLEIVKTRLSSQQNLSFLEFNYPLLQGYDFIHLNRSYSCILQLGGSDQWGNIVTGVQLAQKVLKKELFGLTIPLITRSDGKKMGKSEQGAIWVNEEMLSPYEYFQYWRNVPDNEIEKFANLYCEYDDNEMQFLKATLDKDVNKAKEMLAIDVTKICHGEEAAKKCHKSAVSVFDNSTSLDISELPSIQVTENEITHEIKIQNLLTKTGIGKSNSDSKRLIKNMNCKINNQIISNPAYIIQMSDFSNKIMKITCGKKKICIVQLV